MAKPITIADVRVIVTQPQRERLVIVKVITSEPGLHGLGCATFTQRAFAVKALLEAHLIPFLIGRDVSRIEDIWRMGHVHGYWRNGPVSNNALSGIDQALWDILGKRAGLPVHDLLGGKCREAAAVYTAVRQGRRTVSPLLSGRRPAARTPGMVRPLSPAVQHAAGHGRAVQPPP